LAIFDVPNSKPENAPPSHAKIISPTTLKVQEFVISAALSIGNFVYTKVNTG
jgi:hypothetical protein